MATPYKIMDGLRPSTVTGCTRCDCTTCKPARAKKKAHDCGPVVLALAPRVQRARRFREALWQFLVDTDLPQEKAAAILFNLPAAKLHGYLEGQTVPSYMQMHLGSIESVSRNGEYLTVVHHIGAVSPRWRAMQDRRQAPLATLELEAHISARTRAYRHWRKTLPEFASCVSVGSMLP